MHDKKKMATLFQIMSGYQMNTLNKDKPLTSEDKADLGKLPEQEAEKEVSSSAEVEVKVKETYVGKDLQVWENGKGCKFLLIQYTNIRH